MRIYPAEYLTKLRKLCDEYGVLLIDDEIAAGFGRTGKLFAIEHAGVSPDILCTSKGLTGGYMPMSLTITTDKIYDAFYDDYGTHKAFVHSHTYAGNPLGCAAALAVLRILKRDHILEKRRRPVFISMRNWKRRWAAIRIWARSATSGSSTPWSSWKTGRRRSLSTRPGASAGRSSAAPWRGPRPAAHGDVIYFNPPLTLDRETADKAVALCREAVEDVLGK